MQDEISKLDKEIEDIKKLKEMTASLLARKKVDGKSDCGAIARKWSTRSTKWHDGTACPKAST